MPQTTTDSELSLAEVRRRLELMLAALYGREIPIAASEPAPRGRWYRRFLRRPPPHLRPATPPTAASDGARVHLPPALPLGGGGAEAALARYRLLAIEQAERIVRGTALHAPHDDPLVRDLYQLAESAAVDRAIPIALPGLAPTLEAERNAALLDRPALDAMTGVEREVEARIRAALEGGLRGRDHAASPEDSLAWARGEAGRIRGAGGDYRGSRPVAAWGTVLPVARHARALAVADDTYVPLATPLLLPIKGIERVVGPEGNAAEEEQGHREPTSHGGEETLLDGADGSEGRGEAGAGAASPGVAAAPAGTVYPEWDAREGRYLPRGAVVREAEPVEGDEGWSLVVLERYGGLVRRLREQFERLRARRTRLVRQKSGEELDLDACVRALVDLRAGHPVDDRLYAAVRPARREISILLLIDISGSTDSIVGNIRIIDVEKVALLLTTQALDALGDRYAVLTFSGESAANVRVRTIKSFAERSGAVTRRRIAALRPEGYTRMGAAVRHATVLLGAQRTAHQLLLILSDGRPHDSDHYQGRFAVEDARQAIAEARNAGVHPFCLTVDLKGAEYLTRIFGESGHLILRHPEQLPEAALGVVRHLIRA